MLSLEEAGLLEATRERYPPHYHIAVYPKPYARYVARLTARQADSRMALSERQDYTVRAGDSLWEIAESHGITVDRLKQANNLTGDRIYVGQRLTLPASM